VNINLIVQSVSSAAGAVASTANSGYYLNVYSSAWNNRWTSNTYQLSNLAGNFYIWTGGSSVDDLQWKIYGQDTAGTWVSSTTTFLSTKFSANQRLQTLLSAQVWSLPDTTSTLITTETTGAQGTVTQVAGPIRSGGVWWWNVRYDDGQEGWTQETSLQGSFLPTTAAATPTFSPTAGTYPAPSGITISDTSPGVTIYYTTDGSTPTTASTVYTTQIPLSTASTLKAMAAGNGLSASGVASATYVFQAAKPTISPAAGIYNSAQSVTIADSSPGVTIYYTTNGSTPTASSTVYTFAIPVSATTTIQAIAKRSGFLDSPLASATYTIQ